MRAVFTLGFLFVIFFMLLVPLAIGFIVGLCFSVAAKKIFFKFLPIMMSAKISLILFAAVTLMTQIFEPDELGDVLSIAVVCAAFCLPIAASFLVGACAAAAVYWIIKGIAAAGKKAGKKT